MRRALSILSVLLTATLMVIPAVLADPGGGITSAAGRPDASIDLSSRAGIDRYLTSIGVDREDAVVQRGVRNYAGPNCPGPRWNCTSSSGPVLQVALRGGGSPRNVFVCDPESSGTDPDTNTCVVVQGIPDDGTNEAVCIQGDEQDEGTVAQSCDITQTNDSGDNIATVEQSVQMGHKSTTQRSEQRSSISQTNGTGDNWASVDQRSDLSAKAQNESDVIQEQDVIQDSLIDQETGVGVPPEAAAGDNTADVFQSHRLEAKAHVADSVEQLQNAQVPFNSVEPLEPATSCWFLFDPNICSRIDQLSTDGALLIDLRQELRHDAKAMPVEGDVDQQQGSSEFTGGMVGINHQDSAGVAERFKVQDERQDAKAHAVGGTVTEQQFTGQGPRINSDQVFNENNVAMGEQTVIQTASDPTFQQLQIGALAVPISGEAVFEQHGCQNGECEEQTISGGPPGVFAELGCTSGEPPGEGDITVQQETECTEVGGPTEEPSPEG